MKKSTRRPKKRSMARKSITNRERRRVRREGASTYISFSLLIECAKKKQETKVLGKYSSRFASSFRKKSRAALLIFFHSVHLGDRFFVV